MKSYMLERSVGLFLLFLCTSFGPGFQEIPILSFLNLVVLLILIHTTTPYSSSSSSSSWMDTLCLFVVFSLGEFIAYSQVLGSDFTSLTLTAILATAFVLFVGIFCAIPLTLLPRRFHFFAIPTISSSLLLSSTSTSLSHFDVIIGHGAPFIFPISFTAVWFFITHVFPTGAWGTYGYIGLHQSSSYIRQLSIYFGIDGIHFWIAWAASLVFCYIALPIMTLIEQRNHRTVMMLMMGIGRHDNNSSSSSSPMNNDTVIPTTETHLLNSNGESTFYTRVFQQSQSSSSSSNIDDLHLDDEDTHSLPTLDNSMDVSSKPSSPPLYDTMMNMEYTQQPIPLQFTPQPLSLRQKNPMISFTHGFHHILTFVLITFFLFLYPNIQSFTSYGQFYQTNIETWTQDSIRAVCLAGYGSMVSIQERLAQTYNISQRPLFLSNNDFSPQTAQLILWSEESWYVNTMGEENYIFQQVGHIASTSNVTIGIGYRARLDMSNTSLEYHDSYRNMFILVNTQGKVILKYQKVHPVPGIEDDIEPGKERAPLVVPFESMPHVTMGAAICFDYDFPTFIQKTTRGYDSSGSLIMLQPGWDWGPIGIVHARMVAQRAVENGFTLFRCSSGGVSGVYDAYGNVLTETIMGTKVNDTLKSASSYTTRIPILPRVRTLYSVVGDTCGIICLFLWMVLMLLVLVRDSWIRRFATVTSILKPR